MASISEKEIFFPQIPLNKNALETFKFDSKFLSSWSFLCFNDSRAYRLAAFIINNERGATTQKEGENIPYAKASEINAAALLNRIYRQVFKHFQTELAPDLQNKITTLFKSSFTNEDQTLLINTIEKNFPVNKELCETLSISDLWIRSLIIRLDNENPALTQYLDLFSDEKLFSDKKFANFLNGFNAFFNALPKLSADNQLFSLLDFLREPFKRFPNSLFDQLFFIKEKWGYLVGDLLDEILFSLDFLKEENKPVFAGFGPPQTTDFGLLNDEYEAFTDDKSWMPNVIMLAKSTLVWLDQLSKKYKTHIQHLHQIPLEELQLIASRGFTAIWLIGIWERSKGSKRIKHICGNTNAEASAYSLHDYEIAQNLGGWQSLQQLREKCNSVGLRLASDMVPNHTALDSKWVIERPDLFLQLPYNPIPNYSFNGENLSGRDDVGVFLEDKYYNQSDCAVVFKRVNFHTGEERYIYHGNDGTGLPWNDTAQLNFLNPQTREAVYQTILHVARNFSIIRFDAAMTLAKKHIQRLWFPAPGQGGDIPTRSEHSLSTADFNAAIPKEFWREVVDRLAVDAPDTLLLAEAFWMLEGYFVRTLGMHRVYNSAFMHMLRDEHNQKFRNLIKETLEFDPQILKRYVNFMNNPDEETAAEQFGKGDKYFGICLFLATIPGLPMFGHGQIEGFYEKYGMEFKQALWNEEPDRYLIARHEEEIFPILRKRYLFSEVENFRLYNFENGDVTNENVYAYSNRCGSEHALIAYNNCFESTSGYIKTGVPYKIKSQNKIDIFGLGEFLLAVAPPPQNPKNPLFVVFHEEKSGLDFIRYYDDIWNNGIFCILQGYQYQIFNDFKTVEDSDGSLTEIYNFLNGNGTEELLLLAKNLKYKNEHKAFSAVLNPLLLSGHFNLHFYGFFQSVDFRELELSSFEKIVKNEEVSPLLKNNIDKILPALQNGFFQILQNLKCGVENKEKVSDDFQNFLSCEMEFNPLNFWLTVCLLFALAVSRANKKILTDLGVIDFLYLTLRQRGLGREACDKILLRLNIALFLKENDIRNQKTYSNPTIIDFLKLNNYNKISWFDLPPFEELLFLNFLKDLSNSTIKIYEDIESGKKTSINVTLHEPSFYAGEEALKNYKELHDALLKSKYQLAKFLENIKN